MHGPNVHNRQDTVAASCGQQQNLQVRCVREAILEPCGVSVFNLLLELKLGECYSSIPSRSELHGLNRDGIPRFFLDFYAR